MDDHIQEKDKSLHKISTTSLLLMLLFIGQLTADQKADGCFPLQVARMYSQTNKKYYYSYNYASTPRSITLNLTCDDPRDSIVLSHNVFYQLPMHETDYCTELSTSCTIDNHCTCCDTSGTITKCTKTKDISRNKYCSDAVGSCSLTVPRNFFTNDDCPGIDYKCDFSKPGRSTACYARWVHVEYQCKGKEPPAQTGPPRTTTVQTTKNQASKPAQTTTHEVLIPEASTGKTTTAQNTSKTSLETTQSRLKSTTISPTTVIPAINPIDPMIKLLSTDKAAVTEGIYNHHTNPSINSTRFLILDKTTIATTAIGEKTLHLQIEIYIGVAVALVALVTVFILLLFCLWRKKKHSKKSGNSHCQSSTLVYKRNPGSMPHSATAITMVSQSTNTNHSLPTTPDVIPAEYTPLCHLTNDRTTTQSRGTIAETSQDYSTTPPGNTTAANAPGLADMVENNYYESSDVNNPHLSLLADKSQSLQIRRKHSDVISETGSYQEIDDIDVANQASLNYFQDQISHSDGGENWSNQNTASLNSIPVNVQKLSQMGLNLSDYMLEKPVVSPSSQVQQGPPLFQLAKPNLTIGDHGYNINEMHGLSSPTSPSNNTIPENYNNKGTTGNYAFNWNLSSPLQNEGTKSFVFMPNESEMAHNQLLPAQHSRSSAEIHIENQLPDYDYTYSHFHNEGRQRSPYLKPKN